MKILSSIFLLIMINFSLKAQFNFVVKLKDKTPVFNKIAIVIQNQDLIHALSDPKNSKVYNGLVKNNAKYTCSLSNKYQYDVYFLDTISGKTDILMYDIFIKKLLQTSTVELILEEKDTERVQVVAFANQEPEPEKLTIEDPDKLQLIVDEPVKPSIEFNEFMFHQIDTTCLSTLKSLNKIIELRLIIDKSGKVLKHLLVNLPSDKTSPNNKKLLSELDRIVSLYQINATFIPAKKIGYL